MPLDQMPNRPGVVRSAGRTLRELAAAGRLSASRDDSTFMHLRAAAYEMVWPLVWLRHTKQVEVDKGHLRCASSFGRMENGCLDGFHDDVESVIDYLFNYAKQPIANLEGWITSRIRAATVDGYRRRRGSRGALQRIRVPRWLSNELDNDPWLVELAARIIEWVGVSTTAGVEIWPLEAWSDLRAAVTAAPAAPAVTAADVERVLAAMSTTHPNWFAKYIERPLGRKPFPVGMRSESDRPSTAEEHLRAERDDAVLARLAAATADAISAGLADGCDPDELVPRVLRALLLGSAATDSPVGRDEWLSSVLADERAAVPLVRDVLAVIRCPDVG